ncbi:hypothetical protein [Bifidobacterium saguini]|nr:hypothetical protein [Bifidobacterium saguini]
MIDEENEKKTEPAPTGADEESVAAGTDPRHQELPTHPVEAGETEAGSRPAEAPDAGDTGDGEDDWHRICPECGQRVKITALYVHGQSKHRWLSADWRGHGMETIPCPLCGQNVSVARISSHVQEDRLMTAMLAEADVHTDLNDASWQCSCPVCGARYKVTSLHLHGARTHGLRPEDWQRYDMATLPCPVCGGNQPIARLADHVRAEHMKPIAQASPRISAPTESTESTEDAMDDIESLRRRLASKRSEIRDIERLRELARDQEALLAELITAREHLEAMRKTVARN